MFKRIAIADYGGSAWRAVQTIQTMRELSSDLRVTLIHHEDEPLGAVDREVDEIVLLPTPQEPEAPTEAAAGSGRVARWLERSAGDVNAVWVGWGHPDTHLAIAVACERTGATFVGPTTATLRSIGDRTVLNQVASVAGMELSDISDPVPPQARYLEVQVLADGSGGVWVVAVVDRLLAPDGRPLLASSPAPNLDPAQLAALERSAHTVAATLGLRGAAAIDLLLMPTAAPPKLLGVRPHLTPTHVLAELATGLDVVERQLALAAGLALDTPPPERRGHAVATTLCIDELPDPSPSRTTVDRFAIAAPPGVRVDAAVREGDQVPAQIGTELVTIGAVGRDRPVALARLTHVVSRTTIMLGSGATDRLPLLQVLRHPDVYRGALDTGWLDRQVLDRDLAASADHIAPALAAAAIEVDVAAAQVDLVRFLSSAAHGRPQLETRHRRPVELQIRGQRYRALVSRVGPNHYLLEIDGKQVTATFTRNTADEATLVLSDRRYRILSMRQGADLVIDVDGASVRVTSLDAGVIRASHPSVVVRISVKPDDDVDPGDPLAVLESMKMETVVAAPFAGRIEELLVGPNMQLRAGDPILRVQPAAHATGVGPPPAATELFSDTQVKAPDPKSRRLRTLDELRRLVLGYDVPAHEVTESLEPADLAIDEEVLQAELCVLRAFADITMLARDRRLADEVTDASDRSEREHFRSFLRTLDVDAAELPSSFREQLRVALAHHDVNDLERTPELEAALYRIHLAHRRASAHVPAILPLLGRWLAAPPILPGGLAREVEETLERLIRATELAFPTLGNLARRTRHQMFEQPRRRREREVAHDRIRRHLRALARGTDPQERDRLMAALVAERELLLPLLLDPEVHGVATIPLLEALTRRYYRERDPQHVEVQRVDGTDAVVTELRHRRRRHRVVAASGDDLLQLLDLAAGATSELDADADAALDAYLVWPDAPPERGAMVATLLPQLEAAAPSRLRRVTVTTITRRPDGRNVPELQLLTFEPEATAWFEQRYLRGIHPMIADRLDLWRLEHFDLTRLPSSEDSYLFDCIARDHPSDVRLFAMGEVRDLTPTVDAEGRITGLPELERILAACLDDLRHALAELPTGQRPDWNRILLNVWPVVDFDMDDFDELIRALAPLTTGLGIEQVMVQARVPRPNGKLSKRCIRVSYSPGRGVTIQVTAVPTRPLRPLDDLASRVARARRRGTVHPAEVIPLLIEPQARSAKLTRDGSMVEHDLDDRGELVPVERDLGANTAGIVVGVVTTPTDRYPEGLTRVALLGDPTRGLGALAEPECRRIISALDLAQQLGAPVEWFAVSSGARIAMDSGTENMDWIGRVLRRIVEFTQGGGEINVVVTGINVGAQPYWNAEATMLMHTKGILVMTPDSTMVLTGKQALDYSGGVSAEDNLAIGGYERIMGPNGQAQYWAPDVAGACEVLFRHYDLTYVLPGEHAPRRLETTDPHDRDVRSSPHTVEGIGFTRIGDIFSDATNPGRKKPFDIRTLMRAVADQDREPLERWRDMAEAQSAVVLDAQLGGRPVSLLGVESRSRERRGPVPVDGPTRWTAGTLFPKASKKLARAINAASGRRPLVVLGNLSGFDGSPESLRELQLEFGAEIARAVVNFDGPIVFCVVSRYHGGAFVVFSRTLNDSMEIAALEGSRASVIGGAPAAAVVFAAEVDARTAQDPWVLDLEARLETADETDLGQLRAELDAAREAVRSEKLGEVAGEFDAIHDVERAVTVGSIDRIISGRELRPYLIDAVEAGVGGYRSRTDR